MLNISFRCDPHCWQCTCGPIVDPASHAALPQLQARSNHTDDCHRILVPKSQVESILQCFGLIFILMDRLGALWSALGANLEKEHFLETPCI